MAAKQKPFSNLELSAFCSQMALILKSGISAAEGISILGQDDTGERKEFYSLVTASLEEGDSLGIALRKTGLIPEYACDMIEIGVQSGRTDEVMEALVTHYEREEDIASSIRSAVAYPAVMIGMMFAVIIVLITKVLPIFHQVFLQLGSGLTGLSMGLMNIGTVLSRYSVFFLFLLAALALFVFLLSYTAGGRRLRAKIARAIPPVRRLQQQLSVGRFADGLSIALSSGLSIEDGLQISGRLATDPKIRQKIDRCLNAYREGASFPEAVLSAQIFSGLYAKMLAVGFQAGATENVLSKIAQRNAQESEEKISQLISILEPTLVAILSCIVGLILLSVMLPLLGIMASVGM